MKTPEQIKGAIRNFAAKNHFHFFIKSLQKHLLVTQRNKVYYKAGGAI